MKKRIHPGGVSALLLAATLSLSAPSLIAQSGSTPPPSQDQQQQAPAESKTFTGKVQKLPNGQFALVTGQTADGKLSGHFLDDQEDAKKYDGKDVKVTGTFDTASNTIHVTNIEAA